MYIDPQAPKSAVLPRGQQLYPLGTLGIANQHKAYPLGKTRVNTCGNYRNMAREQT